MNDNDDKGRLNDDINFSAPGGDFQSVLDDDMVPFEQVSPMIWGGGISFDQVANPHMSFNICSTCGLTKSTF